MTTLEDRRDHAAPSGVRPDSDALIKEARRLRRRRYLTVGAVFLVVVATAAAGLWLSRGGGGRTPGGGHQGATTSPRAVPPTSAQKAPGVALPSSALFTQISVSADGLLLTGVTDANGESPESSPQSTCVAAPLDPRSLAVGTLTVGSCGDPLLFGQSAEAVTTPDLQSNNMTITVNAVNPATGHVSDGPAVMTYEYSSDTHPVLAYGSQWLWIYDVATTNGPELLQVSTESGDVVDTIPMPALYRPLLSADDAGVWVANSIGSSAAPALSYVEAGASASTVVIPDTTQPICWLEADSSSAWIGAGLEKACAKQAVERFVDHGRSPAFSEPGNYTPFTVIGDASEGLWTMQYSGSEEEILHIDPDTGTESVAATLPSVQAPVTAEDEGLDLGQAVYLDGALYLLEPPFRENGYLGYSSIVRIIVPHNG